MPVPDTHGLLAPLDSDPFAPAADMRAGRSPFHSRTIIPVANQSARNSLATAHAPTTAKPLYVYRSDLDEIQYTTNGTTWRTPGTGPGARLTRTAAQTMTNNTYVNLSWDTAAENPDGMWSASQPTRITFPRAGQYLITGGVGVSGATSGQFVIALIRGGTDNIHSRRLPAGDAIVTPFAEVFRFSANQYIEVQFLQNSGANRNTYTTAEVQPSVQATWQRP